MKNYFLITHKKDRNVERNPYEWAIKYRQPVSITVTIFCVFLLFLTPHSWPDKGILKPFMDGFGYVLVVIAAFGRIWSTLYISGYKEDRVVVEGPYAIIRNPLYVFSFLGAMGMGLVTSNLLILATTLFTFCLYYRLVVLAEEKNLQEKFGQAYFEYTSSVPRFIPRTFRLIEPDTYPVRPRHVRRSLQQIMWFFWLLLILNGIEYIHKQTTIITFL